MTKEDILNLLGYALEAMSKEEDAQFARYQFNREIGDTTFADRDLGHAYGIRGAKGILMRVIDKIKEESNQ